MHALVWCVWCAWCAWAAARELDPAACAARFDVQRDKIIRTEESREMGARYLSELDAGARAECLRLCCETDACDVFVFEEKSPGSCYLFTCGPPEDFRCKFTAHGNFSSGVLAISRRLAELQDRERLAHHERELASLRSPPSSTPSSTPVASSAAPQPPPEPRGPPQPPEPHAPPEPHGQPQPHAPPPLLPTGRCSRYQFECRAGGECIAVYNACDGVPQCADGSDEAAELGCPPPAPRAPPVQLRQSADDGADGEPWPHRLAQAQPPRRYDAVRAGGSHIFSHTGGLVQGGLAQGGLVQGGLEQGGLAQGGPAQGALDAWAPRAWQPPAGEAAWAGAGRRAWPAEQRRAWPVPRPPPAAEELPLYVPSKTMPEMPMVYSSQQQALRDGPKKGFELMSQGPAPTPATPPPARPVPPAPVKPALVDNASKKKALDDFIEPPQLTSGRWTPARGAPAPEPHAWPPSERDGLSERPPAAVLLLVLGTLLTAALGALLACRARAARRRRRAHPRLALDADYLVNGMYL